MKLSILELVNDSILSQSKLSAFWVIDKNLCFEDWENFLKKEKQHQKLSRNYMPGIFTKLTLVYPTVAITGSWDKSRDTYLFEGLNSLF